MADIKISELPETTDLEGLYTIGTDKNNLSKKVSFVFLKDAANYANMQGDYAKEVGDSYGGKLTELESELNIYNPINSFESGYYNLSPAYIGGTLNAVSVAEGGWVRTKLAITKGMRLMLSGLGGGKIITESNEVTEDITAQFISGYYTYSSTNVGAITTPKKNNDGGWRCIAQPVVKGETYTLTGTGGGGARLYCLINSAGVIKAIAGSGEVQSGLVLNVEEDGMLYCSCNKANTFSLMKRYTQTTSTSTNARLYCITNSGGTITHIAEPDFFADNLLIEVEEDGWLYMNAQITVAYSLARLESKFSVIESNISSIEEQLAELGSSKVLVTEDITAQFISGYYTYSSTDVGANTTPTRTYDGGWRCIAVSVKAGETYIISGEGGASARLYCLVNSASVIKAIAGSGEVQSGLVLNVEEDGMLYCSCNKANTFSLIRQYYKEGEQENDGMSWKNGSYEFGRTCNLDYTPPTIDRWSYPESGQRVSAIYAWYDELVADFPQYVSREDCDSVMASLGISKPSAIAELPMYLYKFIPPKAPNGNGMTTTASSIKRIKAFIITGTHPEYMAIWDCLNAMRLICRNWKEDKNLEELRWNADIYIMPCFNLYGVNVGQRTNENGVDLNRNAPTSDWKVQGEGTQTYSGTSAGSEYSSKVLKHYLSVLRPQVFIDHHNTNVGAGTDEGDGKNMIYTHCVEQIGLDVAGVVISQMTRKWKMRYTDTFPSIDLDPTTLFGYTSFDEIAGSIGKYATEQGAFGSTYESNVGILYKNGSYSTDNRQQNSELVSTCATEGFINYLLRCLKAYSEMIGVEL